MGFWGAKTDDLHGRAHRLLDRGWSVIPLLGDGDPTRSKAPAIRRWGTYQHRLPTDAELHAWFQQHDYQAAAVVLGQVSRLIVIDIDSPDEAAAFARAFPDWCDTFTVRSGNRGLPHYYFSLPDGVRAQSARRAGLELRSDGHYVVAPQSCIGGRVWTITHDVVPRTLSAGDLRRLLAYVRSDRPEPQEKRANRLSARFEGNDASDALPPFELIHRYQRLALTWGRNEALFRAACLARDRSWTPDAVQQVLTPVHVRQPASAGHGVESEQSREREAQATIRSAFKRPPRHRPQRKELGPEKGLPNTLREWLLQHDLAQVARLLDALLRSGFSPNSWTTAAQMVEAVRPLGLGRNMVYAALRTRLPDGRPVFDLRQAPSPRTPLPDSAYAVKQADGGTKQCLFGRGTEAVQKRGRPARRFLLPDPVTLCQRLKLPDRGHDPLPESALASVTAYRAALHRALVQRAPGRYSRRWQAARLGVSRRTCRRYDQRAGLTVMPYFHETLLRWETLDQHLPDDSQPMQGCFLVDRAGKRYPARRGIALRMLRARCEVRLMAQGANYYMVAPQMARQQHLVEATAASPVTVPEPHTWMPQVMAMPGDEPLPAVLGDARPDALMLDSTQRAEGLLRAIPALSPPAAAGLAERIYRALRARDTGRSMTRKAAAALAEKYPADLIDRGLEALAQRHDLHNPAGFLIVWLRSHSGAAQRAEIVLSQNNSALAAAHHADWLERQRRSPYAALYANAEDLMGGS